MSTVMEARRQAMPRLAVSLPQSTAREGLRMALNGRRRGGSRASRRFCKTRGPAAGSQSGHPFRNVPQSDIDRDSGNLFCPHRLSVRCVAGTPRCMRTCVYTEFKYGLPVCMHLCEGHLSAQQVVPFPTLLYAEAHSRLPDMPELASSTEAEERRHLVAKRCPLAPARVGNHVVGRTGLEFRFRGSQESQGQP